MKKVNIKIINEEILDITPILKNGKTLVRTKKKLKRQYRSTKYSNTQYVVDYYDDDLDCIIFTISTINWEEIKMNDKYDCRDSGKEFDGGYYSDFETILFSKDKKHKNIPSLSDYGYPTFSTDKDDLEKLQKEIEEKIIDFYFKESRGKKIMKWLFNIFNRQR